MERKIAISLVSKIALVWTYNYCPSVPILHTKKRIQLRSQFPGVGSLARHALHTIARISKNRIANHAKHLGVTTPRATHKKAVDDFHFLVMIISVRSPMRHPRHRHLATVPAGLTRAISSAGPHTVFSAAFTSALLSPASKRAAFDSRDQPRVLHNLDIRQHAAASTNALLHSWLVTTSTSVSPGLPAKHTRRTRPATARKSADRGPAASIFSSRSEAASDPRRRRTGCPQSGQPASSP